MRVIQMLVTFFDDGKPKYSAGAFYAPNDELERQVGQGYAEAIDVADDADVEKAYALADRKTEQAERAVAAAAEANHQADAIAAAAEIIRQVPPEMPAREMPTELPREMPAELPLPVQTPVLS